MSHSWKIHEDRGREGSGWLERSYLARPLGLHARLHKTVPRCLWGNLEVVHCAPLQVKKKQKVPCATSPL